MATSLYEADGRMEKHTEQARYMLMSMREENAKYGEEHPSRGVVMCTWSLFTRRHTARFTVPADPINTIRCGKEVQLQDNQSPPPKTRDLKTGTSA